MTSDQVDLALRLLQSSDWKRFELFAAAFLAAEFPGLRTTASPSGDGGRDGQLFSSNGMPSVMLQYSVTEAWPRKIRDTAAKIAANYPETRLLIYATNQLIGAAADDLRREIIRKHGFALDVRDRNWFVERVYSSIPQTQACEELIKRVVEPFLSSKGLIERKAHALTDIEQRAAFVYLSLQWEDDSREKGLTKLCFDAMVRAVLRGTNADNRISREEVLRRVRDILCHHPVEQVNQRTDAALKRMTRQYIRHYTKQDEFCLTHDEHTKLNERLVQLEQQDFALQAEIKSILVQRLLVDPPNVDCPLEDLVDALAARVRRVLEKFLLSQGEVFASATLTGTFRQLGFDELNDLLIKDIADVPDTRRIPLDVIPIICDVVRELLVEPTHTVQALLRRLADSYTLLAFLQETPDVQQALTKMFAHGDIWIDTNIVLPLFIEEFVENTARRFTTMLRVANDAGLKLWITQGVLEELDAHMNRSLACANTLEGRWHGDLPFLFSHYLLAGNGRGRFSLWLENFRGQEHPLDDIREYLEKFFGIGVMSLSDDADKSPIEFRGAVEEAWYEIRERRANNANRAIDPVRLRKLVKHDVESYVGIIEKRQASFNTPFGFTHWWLTLDKTAIEIAGKLRTRLTDRPPTTPILSADFLINYLAFGPTRRLVSKDDEHVLPVAMGLNITECLPQDVIDHAQRVRKEASGLPPHIVQRRVRDELNRARRRLGPIANEGLAYLEQELETTTS